MPELPEVETVKKDLSRNLTNKKITDVEVKVKKMVVPMTNDFIKFLKGKTVKSVKRRGKMLIFELSKDFLLAHMKMTGQFVFKPKKGKPFSGGHTIENATSVPNKFTHIIIYFNNGILYFNDLRKFGWMKILNKEKLKKETDKIGIEPLSAEFTIEKFIEILEKYPKKTIKQLLMDQSQIAGIGNIYSDEVCFFAKVNPLRKVLTLKNNEKKLLYKGISLILNEAIINRGTSVNTYVDGSGNKGKHADYLDVYKREGEKCHRCKDFIVRKKISGRSAHFCPACQK